MILENRNGVWRERESSHVMVRAIGSRNHFVRVAAATLGLVLLAEGGARADGFDARIYRPSSESTGVGTIDGAKAPDPGVVVPSVASDVSVAPVTLEQGAETNSVIQARWVVEPQLSFGVGSGFGLYARAPMVAGDWGRDASGAPLPTSGILPPSLGVLVPLARNPLNEGHFALRAEVAAPIGSMVEFRGDGQVTGRGALAYGGYWGRAYVVASAGGQLAPVRGIGDAQLGRAITGGFGLRVPLTPSLSAFGSIDTRFDVDVTDQSSGLVSLGLEARSGHSIFRLLGSAGVRDVIGTPRAMISLAWSFDVSRPPAFMQPLPMEPTPPPSIVGATVAESTGPRAPL